MTNTPDGTLVPVSVIERIDELWQGLLQTQLAEIAKSMREDYAAMLTAEIRAALASSPAPIPVSGEVERHALVLLAQFDKFRESDLNHECAHRYLARYELWEDLRAALNHTPTSDQGERAREALGDQATAINLCDVSSTQPAPPASVEANPAPQPR